MNALITLKLFILRGKCISSPVRTLPTCRISTIRVSRSCLSATHRKSLSGQKDECVRIKKSIIVVSAPKGSNRLSCSGSEMSDDTNYYSDSEMDLYEEENDEIDDEEEEEEVAGLGSDGPNDVVMHAVHEYFSVMEKIKELEAGGDRMGDEVTKMLQAYGVMEKENSPPANLQEARLVIEQAVIRLVDYWDGVAKIHTALNQSVLNIL